MLLIYKIEQSWAKEKLAVTLFMDVKKAFDHMSKTKLIKKMIKLDIDCDLIYWTWFFLTYRRVQLVINGHINKEQDIKTQILQRLLVLLILFLVYIGKVFEKVSISYPAISALSFVDNLGFIASKYSVEELAKILG